MIKRYNSWCWQFFHTWIVFTFSSSFFFFSRSRSAVHSRWTMNLERILKRSAGMSNLNGDCWDVPWCSLSLSLSRPVYSIISITITYTFDFHLFRVCSETFLLQRDNISTIASQSSHFSKIIVEFFPRFCGVRPTNFTKVTSSQQGERERERDKWREIKAYICVCVYLCICHVFHWSTAPHPCINCKPEPSFSTTKYSKNLTLVSFLERINPTISVYVRLSQHVCVCVWSGGWRMTEITMASDNDRLRLRTRKLISG